MQRTFGRARLRAERGLLPGAGSALARADPGGMGRANVSQEFHIRRLEDVAVIPLKRILFATDFSKTAALAFDYAVLIARRFGARIDAVHVIPPQTEDTASHVLELEQAIGKAADDVVRDKRLVRAFSADTGLIDEAKSTKADLVILGSHGRTGFRHALLGSVAERVLRLAPCPVLTVKSSEAGGSATARIGRILCPVDFSADSKAALKSAHDFATATGAKLLAMHVVEPILYPVEYGMGPVPSVDLETVAVGNARTKLAELVKADLGDEQVATRVVFGRADQAICDLARDEGYDLILLATHGLTGLKHLLLGSVAERVVRYAHCPVLTMKSS